jgi:nucleotide sugar dehydrogenase
MTTSILHIKPEEIDTNEKRAKFTVSIIGCEPTAIREACLFADAGFKVICADADQSTVNLLAKGKAPFFGHEIEIKLKDHIKTGHVTATSDVKTAVSQSNIIAITTPIRIDEKKKPDYSPIEKVCKQVGASICRDSLVFVMSITGLGSVEGTFKEILENASGFKVGTDLGLAYSPIRDFYGHSLEAMTSSERIVASADKISLGAASTILESTSRNGVRRTNNVKMAEAAILFEAVQRDANTGLANELAILCEKAGVDYSEIQDFTKTLTASRVSLPWRAEEKIQEEPYLLLEDAENLNVKLRIASVAREANEGMAKHAATLARDSLRICGKTMRRARISVFGVSQTHNTKDTPKKMVKELAETLEAKGAKVTLYDPYFSENEKTESQRYFKKSLTEAVEGADCIIIMTGHDQFKRLNLRKVKALMKMPAAIVDLEGALEPDKVEKEGFVYRRLGRGVGAK